MKIGIDISQIAHEGTGVAVYVTHLVRAMIARHPEHEYVLFAATLRKPQIFSRYVASLQSDSKVRLVTVPIPPTVLEWIWNRLHIIPVEWFIGGVDVFWSSDWTQPPLNHAAGITTVHDLSVLRYPEESHNVTGYSVFGARISANIVAVHKRMLRRAAEVCDLFLCDSEATKKDAHTMLGIANDKLRVVYPGFH